MHHCVADAGHILPFTSQFNINVSRPFQMQKTVDINENCLFLKDLEMLRAAPEEPLPSLDERSPDQSPNCLGSFKLQGSNPLEQLGLYMKMDDEEEEEVEPQCIPGPGNDVEEGEID